MPEGLSVRVEDRCAKRTESKIFLLAKAVFLYNNVTKIPKQLIFVPVFGAKHLHGCKFFITFAVDLTQTI